VWVREGCVEGVASWEWQRKGVSDWVIYGERKFVSWRASGWSRGGEIMWVHYRRQKGCRWFNQEIRVKNWCFHSGITKCWIILWCHTRCWLCSSMLFEKWQILNNTRFQPPGTTVFRLLDLDNVNTMTLRNVGKGKPKDTALRLRKKKISFQKTWHYRANRLALETHVNNQIPVWMFC